jgi:hypothetical protein
MVEAGDIGRHIGPGAMHESVFGTKQTYKGAFTASQIPTICR